MEKSCTTLNVEVSVHGTLYLHTWININAYTHVVVQKHNNISYRQTSALFVPSKLMKMGNRYLNLLEINL